MEERNVVILGSGVAGLTAAIYNARADLQPLVLTGMADGGQIATTTMVENWPGADEGIMGPDLVMKMKKQAEKFGAEVKFEQATAFTPLEDGTYVIKTDSNEYKAHAVIIATGASARWLNIESEKQFKSKGVHTCATCDGAFYRNKEIIVVGGGDSAAEESTFLTKFASKVTLLVRKDNMRASVPMQERVNKNEKIEVRYNTEIAEYLGDDSGLQSVKLKNNVSGEVNEMKIDGVFLAIGHVPNTKIFKGLLDTDEMGYLLVKNYVETKLPGVFAAGDVSDHQFRQAITASGSGCSAAILAERYLADKEHGE